MPGPSSRSGSTDARLEGRVRWLVTLGTLAFGGLLSLTATSADAAAYAAKASLAPRLYYLNDTAGSPYTFTVTNTGSATNIGAVEIRRPNLLWKVASCPVGPTGWLKTWSANGCSYRSASTSGDDIKPGQSRTFTVKATTVPGTMNHTGTWNVKVSNTNHFAAPSVVKTVSPTGSGLASTMYTFELTRAVVTSSSRAPGTVCPVSNKTAIAASSRTIVVCGRNRASIALTPNTANSSLGGTFVGTPGTFLSGSIRANSGEVVLADWNATLVTNVPGSGKNVLASIGTHSTRTSSLRLFKHYVATNMLPVANNDAYSVNEDTPLSKLAVSGVLANDTDAESNPLTALNASDPPHGAVTLNTDGSFLYTPDVNYHGTDSFTYVANDGYGNSAPATVTITVDPVNDAPVSSDVTASTNEDTQKEITLAATDVEGSSLTYTVGTPANGTAVVAGDTVTYTPALNFAGTDTFTFKANDGALDSNTSTVTVTVNAVNDAPTANGDSFVATEDTPLSGGSNVLANDADVEGDPMTASLVSGPSNGTLSLSTDGSFTYTPNTNFFGNDSFTYRANDGAANSGVATVAITVNGTQDAPVAASFATSTNEDTAKAITLQGTDVDGDPLTYVIDGAPANGSLGAVSGGSVTYTPGVNFAGGDSFTYHVDDGSTNSAVATVTITVNAVNDAPVANTDSYATDEDTQLVVSLPASGVLANDADVEGSTLTAALAANPTNGTVTLNSDGTFTYTPNLNFNGPDSFTYTANDGAADSATGVVNVTVGAVNDLPVAQTVTTSTSEDTAKAITLVATDVEGDSLTYEIVSGPADGALGTVSGSGVTYTPDPDFAGSDSFTYKAKDAGGDSNTATVNITVNPVNDAPVATGETVSTPEDTTLSQPAPGVLGNDVDVDGDSLTAVLVTAPTTGTGFALNADGSFTWTPPANDSGAAFATFTYKVDDGPAESSVVTATIDVTAVNDVPVADGKSATTLEDTAKTIQLSGDDAVEESNLAFAVVDSPSHGSLGSVTNVQCTAGACTADIQYTPAVNYAGADSFTYKVNDGGDDSAPVTVNITVTAVNDAPSFSGTDVEVVQDLGPYTVSGWATAISKGGADESGQTLTFAVTVDTVTPSDLFSTPPAVNATTGDLTFDVPDTKTGSATISVTLSDNGGTANSGDDESAAQTFTIDVVPPNTAPTADATTAFVNEDSVTGVAVSLSGDDADGDDLTFEFSDPPKGELTNPTTPVCTGTVPRHCTASVTYTPNADVNGSDSFTYKANDGKTLSPAADADITITAVNDTPEFTPGGDVTATEDSGAYTGGTGWATGISEGATNESDQNVTFLVDDDNHALFSSLPAISAAGDLTFTPAVDAFGVANVSVQLKDDGGTANGGDDTSDTVMFTITVDPVNDEPSFTHAGNQTVFEDGGAQNVSNWASSDPGAPNEAAQTLAFVTSNDNEDLFAVQPGVDASGTLTYTPATNAVGFATVSIYVSDSGGTNDGGDDTSPTQTFVITVDPVNDAPSFVKGTDQTVNEDSGSKTVTGWASSILAGPADEAAQNVTFGVTTPLLDQWLFSSLPAITPAGELSFTPATDAFGSTTISVTLTDDGGTDDGGDDTSDVQTFVVTINAVNDEPSFTKGGDQSVDEDDGVQNVSNWAQAISKGPANESAQLLTFHVSTTNDALFAGGAAPAVSDTGTLTFTTGPNKYGSATVSVYLTDDGGTDFGGDDTSPTQQFTITVSPVNDAPVAAPQSYTVQANMKISLGGLLTGATDPNDTSQEPANVYTPTFTVGEITNPDCAECTVTNRNDANGTFDFDPPAGKTGTFTLKYTVEDNGFPLATSATSAEQTITFTVQGPVVWFVDTLASGAETGRLSAPFNTLAEATSAMAASTAAQQRIFVDNGNVTGNVTLGNDGWLVSDAATATPTSTFDNLMGFTPPAGTIPRPSLGGTQRSVNGTVTLGNNSVVRGVDLAPTSGKGLVASGKTGLTVNQMSITSSGSRAVDLANSSGVFSLKRVSSTGADRGISLVIVNTSTGSFTITGDGTANSGGVITTSTAVGSTAAPEAGIYLNDTKNVSLSRMTVSNGQGNGIYGKDVTTFAIDNSTISGNGTDENKDHDGMQFANLLGTSTFNTITVSGSREDNAKIQNTSGTANITVSNSRFEDNHTTLGANGLLVESNGTSSITFTSTSNIFEQNNSGGLAIFAQSTQKMTATVTGGSYATDGGLGLDIESNGAGGMDAAVNGGTVAAAGCSPCGAPVNIFKGTSGTGTGANALEVSVNNMTISNNNSGASPGIWVHGAGAGAVRVALTNNTISQVNMYGIWGNMGNSTLAQSVDYTITGNNVTMPNIPGVLEGINIDSGSTTNDVTATCANISGNTVSSPQSVDIQVEILTNNASFRLPGYSGGSGPTDMVSVENYLDANNPNAVDFNAFKTGTNATGYTGGGACAAVS